MALSDGHGVGGHILKSMMARATAKNTYEIPSITAWRLSAGVDLYGGAFILLSVLNVDESPPLFQNPRAFTSHLEDRWTPFDLSQGILITISGSLPDCGSMPSLLQPPQDGQFGSE